MCKNIVVKSKKDYIKIANWKCCDVSVRGYVSGNRVFVRADHPRYTSEQIMLHEAGHNMIAMGAIDLDEVRDNIAENSNVGKLRSFIWMPVQERT